MWGRVLHKFTDVLQEPATYIAVSFLYGDAMLRFISEYKMPWESNISEKKIV
jgi:hypothetical protein